MPPTPHPTPPQYKVILVAIEFSDDLDLDFFCDSPVLGYRLVNLPEYTDWPCVL